MEGDWTTFTLKWTNQICYNEFSQVATAQGFPLVHELTLAACHPRVACRYSV